MINALLIKKLNEFLFVCSFNKYINAILMENCEYNCKILKKLQYLN